MYDKILAYYSNLTTLSHNDEKALISKLKVINLKKRESILKEDQICDYVYFINSGIVRFYQVVNGEEKTLEFFFADDYFSSYESFLTRKPGNLNIDTLTDTELLVLSYEDVQELYKLSASFTTFGRKISEMYFSKYIKKYTSLLVKSPKRRYLELHKNRPKVIQYIPSYMIASYLGIKPETLSRLKKEVLCSYN